MGYYSCNGKCDKLPGYDPRKKINYAYENGWYRCTVCLCYFSVKSIHCGCCGARLKYKTYATTKRRRIRIEKLYPKPRMEFIEIINP